MEVIFVIRRKDERLIEVKPNLKDGNGSVEFKYIATSEEMFNKVKMFSTLTLNKGDSIGYHTHVGEAEIMYINKGKGLYKDDGQESVVYQGDVTICFENHYHGIVNNDDEPLELIAMVLYK